jgi:hypothetical protein
MFIIVCLRVLSRQAIRWRTFRDEAQNLLGCTAMFLIECRPTFQRCVLPPSSGRWVIASTSEISVDIQLRTRQYIPEDSELHTAVRTWNLTTFRSYTQHLHCCEVSCLLKKRSCHVVQNEVWRTQNPFLTPWTFTRNRFLRTYTLLLIGVNVL